MVAVKLMITFKRTHQDFILAAYGDKPNKKCCQPAGMTAFFI
jgi:hypothetical protein